MGRRKSAISVYSLSSQVYRGLCCFGGARKISGYNEYPTGFFRKEPKEPKSTLLTGQQRLSIIRTWRKLAIDIGPLGISAMNKMLELDCDAKLLFDFSGKNDQDMQHDRRFRQHAFWLIQAVNAVLENLDRLDETVAYMFKQIGEKHAAIPRFHISYFGLLPDVWDYVWEEHLKERYSQHMQTSWDRIFRYIVDRLAEGYYLRAPYEPTAGPSSNSNFSLLSNCSDQNTDSIISTTSPSSSVDSVSNITTTLTPSASMVSFLSLRKKNSKATHTSKKGSLKPKVAEIGESSPSSGLSISAATQSQMLSVQSSTLDQEIGSTDMRKRGDRKGSARSKSSRKGSSSRKLSAPTKDSTTSSSTKPRKTSATSEPIPGNDVTSAGQAPSHKNPPPSEAPVVARADKGPSPKQKKGDEISMNPLQRKRGDRKGSARSKSSRKGSSSRKLSAPTKDSTTSSSTKPRKTSATSEPIPGNDVTSAGQAPSHKNPPPSEAPVVARADKGPSPKQKKGDEISMV